MLLDGVMCREVVGDVLEDAHARKMSGMEGKFVCSFKFAADMVIWDITLDRVHCQFETVYLSSNPESISP